MTGMSVSARLQRTSRRPRRRHVSLLMTGVLIVLGLATVAQAWQLFSAQGLQEQIVAARDGAIVAPTADPAVRLARALHLTRQREWSEALKLYQQVESGSPRSELARIARYNAANLNMREAAGLIADNQRGRALPLVEVAKQMYRQLLREHPDDWSSRYNLSSALMLVPDPIKEEAGPQMPDDAERAITTMRGFSLGMP